jgi:two-component system sensor histidine kinase PilS (NtrC family)
MDELKKQKAMLATQRRNIENLELLNNRLLNSLPVGLMLVSATGQVENINQTANSILGFGSDKGTGRKYYELFPDLKGIFEAWEQMTETQRLRFIFRSREDQPPHLSLRVVPLLNRDGQERQHIIVFQDISKLQALEEKLEFESKLAATGELAAAIAHEIRNPLASISGSIELLSQSMGSRDEQDQKLANIALLEIRRLNRLVTDFLEFAKPKDYSGGDFPLAALLDEVSEAMRNRSNKHPVAIKQNLTAGLSVHANRERMKQVFFNLFINSIEANQSGPVEISVSAERTPEGHIEITVADNGPGIPPEIAGRIFDPFFTTKGEGTGLGLATIAQIMRAAKGNIQLENGSRGASFRLTIPASSTMEMANSAS